MCAPRRPPVQVERSGRSYVSACNRSVCPKTAEAATWPLRLPPRLRGIGISRYPLGGRTDPPGRMPRYCCSPSPAIGLKRSWRRFERLTRFRGAVGSATGHLREVAEVGSIPVSHWQYFICHRRSRIFRISILSVADVEIVDGWLSLEQRFEVKLGPNSHFL